MRLASQSIVIIANAHNPTILHPSFLVAQGIVGSEFVSVEDKLICTPAFSGVTFTNGILISVDRKRLNIRCELPPSHGHHVPSISAIADRYVTVLPHVQYTKIGINFRSVLPMTDPGSFVRKTYVADGAWQDGLVSADVGFRYEVAGGELNVSVDPVKKADDRESDAPVETGVAIRFNYSFALDSASIIDSAKTRLKKFDELKRDMQTKMKSLLNIHS